MIMRRSAEEFLAELEAILARFRAESAGMLNDSGREEAVRRLRQLGFTAGQSLELLRGKKPT
jgi:Fe2+ transport system protein FeoA